MPRLLNIAISGAGVSGPALAYWLRRGGHKPTLIEAAPSLRTGGYMIDFWGVGYDVAERMGIVPAVHAAGYGLQEVRYVDGSCRSAAHISAQTMRRELGDRFTSLPRGDLAATFTPRTALGVWLRNKATKLMTIPGMAGLLVGDQMKDEFILPDYRFSS